MLNVTPKEEYSRADVRRKFGLSERQLKGWERQRLIPEAAAYSFSDLIAFQTLVKLRENKIPEKRFRAPSIRSARSSIGSNSRSANCA